MGVPRRYPQRRESLQYFWWWKGHVEMLVLVILTIVAEVQVVVLRLTPAVVIQEIPKMTLNPNPRRTMVGRVA